MTAVATVREMQVMLLALTLLGACATKLSRVLRARSVQVIVDASALFPPRLRRRATMALCATELSLGLALLATVGRAGGGQWADGMRLAAALFFVLATAALVELRERRPDLDCGCFGDFSNKPPGLRSVGRTALLAAAALASVHSGPLSVPPPGLAAAQVFGVLVTELLLAAALSPELGEALVRLGYSEPCELRVIPAERTLAALRRSKQWRRHAGLLTADMVRPGAAVLDVGISRTEAGLVGDVDPAVAEVAGYLAPMPGGVGPMTRAMLLANVVDEAEAG